MEEKRGYPEKEIEQLETQAINAYKSGNYKQAVEISKQAIEQGSDRANYIYGLCLLNGKGIQKNELEAERHFKNSVVAYEEKALAGDAEAEYILGSMYYYGRGVKKSYLKAAKWFENASLKNHLDAKYLLGNIYYYYGINHKKDYQKALRLYTEVAQTGDVDAQFMVGNIYYYGKSVEKNYEIALKWFEKAAAQNDSYAQKKIADMYYFGYGTKVDIEKSIYWYQKAFENHYIEAGNSLGSIYSEGKKIHKDIEIALEWYKKTAEKGNAYAAFKTANLIESGQTNEKRKNSLYWYEKCIQNCHINQSEYEEDYIESAAYLNAGMKYYIGEGTKVDFVKAFSYLNHVTDTTESYGFAKYLIGMMYLRGEGTSKNEEKAIENLTKASEKNVPSAQFILGELYYSGIYVDQNTQEAFKNFKNAAETGHQIAQYMIGYSYENGYGVTQNKQEAVRWYKKLVQDKNQATMVYQNENRQINYDETISKFKKICGPKDAYSQYLLGSILCENQSVEGIKWLEKAADQNYTDAYRDLGNLYLDGSIVSQNLKKAEEFFQKAANQGDQEAQTKLQDLKL